MGVLFLLILMRWFLICRSLQLPVLRISWRLPHRRLLPVLPPSSGSRSHRQLPDLFLGGGPCARGSPPAILLVFIGMASLLFLAVEVFIYRRLWSGSPFFRVACCGRCAGPVCDSGLLEPEVVSVLRLPRPGWPLRSPLGGFPSFPRRGLPWRCWWGWPVLGRCGFAEGPPSGCHPIDTPGVFKNPPGVFKTPPPGL